ncbi:GDSL esterase/lipase At2g40250-like [Punica granatum]|uniref:Uncharacterized protein n=2 Tax=Punica granatum TaxID=22663 RepID=A0A218W1R8_PUNGR|nr:GDSL esterase/lipase At2g40250-like [Punica granatum]OWM66408.1 hypothetical protein CDL15_Pgr013625 [Punica granatum]PKI69996.1 hypothetical protein CRG98_009599 [Punica granatum]
MEFSKLLIFTAYLGLLLSVATAGSHPEHHHHHHHHHHNHSHTTESHKLMQAHKQQASISAVFAFGDSSVDTGNNNINYGTRYRSDHLPYGMDFSYHTATGRSSNGRLIVDYIISSLGLKDTLTAYVGSPIEEFQTGISYGISGAGLDDNTVRANSVPTFDQQVISFEHTIQYLIKAVGEKRAKQIVKDALYIVSVGTNDMVDTYYRPLLQIGLTDIGSYHYNLLLKLEGTLQRLYKDGARKFVVLGMPPIGCLPKQVSAISLQNLIHTILYGRDCIDEQNNDAQGYNMKLRDLVSSINSQVPDIHVEYVDIYGPMMDMISNPYRYGFESTIVACCGLLGLPMVGDLCNELTPRCPNPNQYLFWDSINPTQVVNAQLAGLIANEVLPKFH